MPNLLIMGVFYMLASVGLVSMKIQSDSLWRYAVMILFYNKNKWSKMTLHNYVHVGCIIIYYFTKKNNNNISARVMLLYYIAGWLA